MCVASMLNQRFSHLISENENEPAAECDGVVNSRWIRAGDVAPARKLLGPASALVSRLPADRSPAALELVGIVVVQVIPEA